jgi:hypothetical protein
MWSVAAGKYLLVVKRTWRNNEAHQLKNRFLRTIPQNFGFFPWTASSGMPTKIDYDGSRDRVQKSNFFSRSPLYSQNNQ